MAATNAKSATSASASARIARPPLGTQRRELVADYAGAQATGNPAAMVSALRRLEGKDDQPTSDLRATETVRGLCFLPHGFDAEGDSEEFRVSARSHPSVEARVENLRELTASV